MPAVLVLILCVVHGHIRREGLPEASATNMSAADLIAALRLAREIETANAGVPHHAAREALAAIASDENVTALSAARAGKKD
jgi:hypothetical protein